MWWPQVHKLVAALRVINNNSSSSLAVAASRASRLRLQFDGSGYEQGTDCRTRSISDQR